MTDEAQPRLVCLITGVGPGTGGALARRFADGGYTVAMLARDATRLADYERDIAGARAYPCDVTDGDALAATVEAIRSDLGAPAAIIHNAVGGAFGDFLEIEPAVLIRNFEINTVALLRLAQLTIPTMMTAGEGVFLCTGNTSAFRGKSGFAGFAPTKAAQRILMESIARRSGPDGVHAAYIAIDGVIDVPWTRERLPDKPDSFFVKPDDIADECYRIARQPRSAWSFQVEIRPFGEAW